jgi:hypothetical protein
MIPQSIYYLKVCSGYEIELVLNLALGVSSNEATLSVRSKKFLDGEP